MRIHAQHCEAGLSAMQESAGIYRTKRPLQIGGCDEARSHVSREAPLEGALQAALIGNARGPFRRRSALIALPANLELTRACLSQPLHRQPEHLMLDLDIEHAPDQVAFRRPKMKQAFVVFPRNRIFCLRQVKDGGAVIEHDGITCSGEKILYGSSQCLGSHG